MWDVTSLTDCNFTFLRILVYNNDNKLSNLTAASISEKGEDYISTFSIWLIAKALDADLNELLDFDMKAFRPVIEKAMQKKHSS